jgi:hypothetical protein
MYRSTCSLSITKFIHLITENDQQIVLYSWSWSALSGGSASAVSKLTPNNAIMVQFIPPIASFAAILSIGIIAGGITYIATYLAKK